MGSDLFCPTDCNFRRRFLVQSKLYHMGFRGRVSRSTLAAANEAHDWRIFADFAQVLIRIARPL